MKAKLVFGNSNPFSGDTITIGNRTFSFKVTKKPKPGEIQLGSNADETYQRANKVLCDYINSQGLKIQVTNCDSLYDAIAWESPRIRNRIINRAILGKVKGGGGITAKQIASRLRMPLGIVEKQLTKLARSYAVERCPHRKTFKFS